MPDRYSCYVQQLVEAVLMQSGVLDSELRQRIEVTSAHINGSPACAARALPEELTVLVNKIALHAYRVTDEDVEALKRAGYSEDALFEVILSAALGAGMARLKRGLVLLEEEAGYYAIEGH